MGGYFGGPRAIADTVHALNGSVRSRATFFGNNKFSTKTISHLIFQLIIHCARIRIIQTHKFAGLVSVNVSSATFIMDPSLRRIENDVHRQRQPTLNISLICFTWKLSHRQAEREREREPQWKRKKIIAGEKHAWENEGRCIPYGWYNATGVECGYCLLLLLLLLQLTLLI